MTGDGSGKVLNLVEICAELVDKRNLRPWEIEQLDRWWIAHVYWHPRNEKGELIISVKESAERPKTPKDEFWEFGKSWGWEDWFCAHQYALAQKRAAQKAVDEMRIAKEIAERLGVGKKEGE